MHKIIFTKLFLLFITATVLPQETWQASGAPVPLTPQGRYFMQPIYSPDGEKIALAGKNYQGIWIINPDGQNLQALTEDLGAGYKFTWSSDSKEIATRTIKYHKRRRLQVIKIFNVEKKQSRVLAEYKSSVYTLPKWTLDDKKIYIFTKKGLEFMDSKKPLANENRILGKTQPVFYTAKNRLVLANRQGKELNKIKPVKGNYLNAVLSPDGQKIAFQVFGGNLYTVNIDGSGLIDLGRGERPCWAPDSAWLVYMLPADDGHQFLSSDIYVIKMDGTGKTNLTQTDNLLEMNPNWSPNGNSIVYDERQTGRIYKLSVQKQ